MSNGSFDVVIVGAGVAGLACALHLERSALRCVIIEQANDVGGRVRTDSVDGFRLDHGFQIFLTAYPEASRLLDYGALRLANFTPGAAIWTGNGFERLVDLRRERGQGDVTATLRNRVMSWGDFWKTFRMVRQSGRPTGSMADELQRRGFSAEAVGRFWRPFLGGVLLESGLTTSAEFGLFTLRMFERGTAALPAEGIGTIPRWMRNQLRHTEVRLGTTVARAEQGRVRLEKGETLTCGHVVVATEQAAALRLTGQPGPNDPFRRATACLYFAMREPVSDRRLLMLDGTGQGPINTVVPLTNVQPGYAPTGWHLLSASTVGLPPGLEDDGKLLEAARSQLASWFGERVREWRHLRTYRIHEALPDNSFGAAAPAPVDGMTFAGDWTAAPSLNGAMASGRLAAERVLAERD